jgi:hypothetical protein
LKIEVHPSLEGKQRAIAIELVGNTRTRNRRMREREQCNEMRWIEPSHLDILAWFLFLIRLVPYAGLRDGFSFRYPARSQGSLVERVFAELGFMCGYS